MSAMSDYIENKLVDWLFRGVAYTPPATLYFALFTATPSDAGGGTEVSGGSYARVAMTGNSTNFANTQNSGVGASSGTGGTTQNLVAVTFPAPTANWGVVTSVGVFDASSAGNLVFYGSLTVSKTVNNGDAAPSFAVGAFTYQIDN